MRFQDSWAQAVKNVRVNVAEDFLARERDDIDVSTFAVFAEFCKLRAQTVALWWQHIEHGADHRNYLRWLEGDKELPRWFNIARELVDYATAGVRVQFCKHEYVEDWTDYEGGFVMTCEKCGHGFSGRF